MSKDQVSNRSERSELEIFPADVESSIPLPFAEHGIQAGFPSPAQDYLTESLDLNREIVVHPASTFYGRVSGNSMIDEGVEDGDLLVIDRSLEPQNDDLTVCCVDGDFTLKRIRIEPNCIWLIPANEAYDPILVTPETRFTVWGVVTYVIKRKRRHIR